MAGDKIRLGGMALPNGVLVHGPTSWGCAVRLPDGTIKVAGSITLPLSDYAIVAPNIGGFIVSIADDGTLEFLVNFTKG